MVVGILARSLGSGAFDSFGASRAYNLSVIPKIISRINAEQKEKAKGQEMLFSNTEHRTQNTELGVNHVEEFSPEELLKMEKDMLGMYISSHPLHFVAESLEAQVTKKINEIADMHEGEELRIGGLLSACRRITTKKGDLMMVGSIEDLSGTIGLVVFPKTYKKYADFCNNDQIVVVKGKVNRDMRTDDFNVIAESLDLMEEMEKKRSLHIELVGITDGEILGQVKNTLLDTKGDDPVFIRLEGKTIQLGEEFSVDINPDLIEQLESVLGSGAVDVRFKSVKKEKQIQEVKF